MGNSQRLITIDANNTSSFIPLDTSTMFNRGFIENNESPIDTYFNKIQSLVILVNPASFNEINANLVVLGCMSVFESYMREMIRRTILIDEITRKNCELMPITYGAAISHNSGLLPEAILEDISFAGKDNIKESLKQFIGIKGHLPNSLSLALEEFSKVCEIRHCLVHRFGKLGTKNAIKLGLTNHSICIEKPLQLDFTLLQSIQLACNVVVKEINNYVFNSLLQRLIIGDDGKKKTSTIWTWNFTRDRNIFSKYYKTFVSSNESTVNHSSAKGAFDLYRDFYKRL